jgi:hypothetical protein
MSQLNKMEQEVVYLSAVNELLRSMLNYELITQGGEGKRQSIQFKTMTHQQFFFIALVDFLSMTDKKALVPSTPYLRALKSIAEAPSFEENFSVFDLKKAVDDFTEWLSLEIAVDLWLPSIILEAEIRVPRYLVLKIVGNLSKHNSLRSVGVAEELQGILNKAGYTVELYQAMLAQEEMYEIFHDDVCAYQASTIAEHLNRLLWGIKNYLMPEYSRSFTPDINGSSLYRFQYPTALEHKYARSCYWNLMNQVRSAPDVELFTVTEHLKGRY